MTPDTPPDNTTNITGDVDGPMLSGISGSVDARSVHTGGGDYAEGSIDKRQGTFIKGHTENSEKIVR